MGLWHLWLAFPLCSFPLWCLSGWRCIRRWCCPSFRGFHSSPSTHAVPSFGMQNSCHITSLTSLHVIRAMYVPCWSRQELPSSTPFVLPSARCCSHLFMPLPFPCEIMAPNDVTWPQKETDDPATTTDAGRLTSEAHRPWYTFNCIFLHFFFFFQSCHRQGNAQQAYEKKILSANVTCIHKYLIYKIGKGITKAPCCSTL